MLLIYLKDKILARDINENLVFGRETEYLVCASKDKVSTFENIYIDGSLKLNNITIMNICQNEFVISLLVTGSVI